MSTPKSRAQADLALQAEVVARQSIGMVQVKFDELKAMIRELGYRFDMDMACRSVARYMTGARAGESYLSNSLYPVQIDDGKSYAHFESRRDSNWQQLKAIRDKYFSVHAGHIYEW